MWYDPYCEVVYLLFLCELLCAQWYMCSFMYNMVYIHKVKEFIYFYTQSERVHLLLYTKWKSSSTLYTKWKGSWTFIHKVKGLYFLRYESAFMPCMKWFMSSSCVKLFNYSFWVKWLQLFPDWFMVHRLMVRWLQYLLNCCWGPHLFTVFWIGAKGLICFYRIFLNLCSKNR